jgi:predicted nucleic acid-binding protein
VNVVIDTSVAIAWYANEKFSKPAREWQDRLLSGRLHAMVPPLHYVEFANALRAYVLRREMDRRLAEDVYALHLDAPLDAVEPPRAAVLATALEFSATAYDAAFISLAMTCDCPLVTAERSTAPWVVKLGQLAITVG